MSRRTGTADGALAMLNNIKIRIDLTTKLKQMARCGAKSATAAKRSASSIVLTGSATRRDSRWSRRSRSTTARSPQLVASRFLVRSVTPLPARGAGG